MGIYGNYRGITVGKPTMLKFNGGFNALFFWVETIVFAMKTLVTIGFFCNSSLEAVELCMMW